MVAPSVDARTPPRSVERLVARAMSAVSRHVVSGLLIVAPIVIVFLGYALRVWRIAAFSITPDELDSLLFATVPFRELFTALATHEPHPPFYYLFLHGWVAATGQSELMLRLPSVLFGTFAVAGAYNAGRTIGGRAAGMATAAILATSQFSLLHSQEARMYAVLQAWAALFLAALLHYLRRPTRSNGALLALAGLFAAYTHYHGLLLVMLGVVPILVTTPPRRLPVRLSPFVVIAAGYAPWVVYAQQIFLGYRGWMGVVPPLDALRQSAVAYSVGVGVTGAAGKVALVVLPAFAIAGLVTLTERRQWRTLVTLLCLSALPLLVVVAGSATGRALYNERYLIVVTPAYLTLAGVGLAFVSRAFLARPFALAAVAALGAVSLPAYYWPAIPLNPNARGTVALVEQNAGPSAVVVLPEPASRPLIYYLKDRLPTYVAPDRPSPEAVAADLGARLAGRNEVWFVRYPGDPGDDAIARWLEANAYFVRDQWVTQNHVLTYALAPPIQVTDRPVSFRLANGTGITMILSGPRTIRPGERAIVGFRWSVPDAAAKPIPPNLKVSLRLIDPWGQAVGAFDRRLVNPAELAHLDARPSWQGALPVPMDAVPGPYRLEARFYDEASGQAVTVADASGGQRAALDLGATTVEPADATALARATPPDSSAVELGPGLYAQRVELAGTPYSQYSRLVTTFVWASQANQSEPIIPELGIRSASGTIVTSARREEAEQPYPLRRLRAGERVREHLDLSLRTVAASGTYSLVLRTGANRPWTPIGSINVAVDLNRAESVPMTESRSDLFDGVIRLVGANVPARPVAAGSAIAVSLGWYAERHPGISYTVFIHLVRGSGGAPLAQSDGIPGSGKQPTADWVPGDYIVDAHQIAVSPTLAAGEYRLIVGLYDPNTGRRAEVIGSSSDGQTADLGTITISAR